VRASPLVLGSALLALGAAAPDLGSCADRRAGAISVPADSAAGEVPFRFAGSGGAAIVVPVSVDGRAPVDLILDTGATLTCVDAALAREWALPEQRFAVGRAVGIGASGRVTLHGVDSLRVGSVVARKLTVCSMDLRALQTVGAEVRGLLGLNLLRRFRVTLDFERRVLRLDAPGTGRDASPPGAPRRTTGPA
jgi:predicted aspartyl protease